MELPLYKRVALRVDIPEKGLEKGDVVTTVEFLKARRDLPNAYCVESFNAVGETIAVFTVAEDDLELLTEHDVLSKRTIRATGGYDLPSSRIQVFSEEDAISKNLTPVKTLQPNTVLIELSDGILKQKGLTTDEAKLHIAVVLFQHDFYSIGKASELAGLHPSQFQKELARRQLSVHYDVGEFLQDINTLDSYEGFSPVHHTI